jgi:hypothetical protein
MVSPQWFCLHNDEVVAFDFSSFTFVTRIANRLVLLIDGSNNAVYHKNMLAKISFSGYLTRRSELSVVGIHSSSLNLLPFMSATKNIIISSM